MVDENGELVPVDHGIIAQQSRAEIDMQIATAKQFPRSILKAETEARDMILADKETAAQCFYAIPRDGKTIEGPSVRLAEILVYTMGNIRADARPIGESEDGKSIICQGTCMDTERNIASRIEIRRRIIDRNGRRYSDDMINTTANAGCAIAYRNAIFKVIPRFMADKLYKEAKKASVGSDTEARDNASKWADYFKARGIPEKTLLKHLGLKSLSKMTADQGAYLIGLRTAIEDKEVTVDEVFELTRDGKPMDPKKAPASKKDVKPDDDKARQTLVDNLGTAIMQLEEADKGAVAQGVLVDVFGFAFIPDDATTEQLLAVQERFVELIK